MRIFYDTDTQNDFMNKNGALYVPNAELIKANLCFLTNYALRKAIPIIGSVDNHFGTEEFKEREGELAKYGGPFPNHCMNKTFGQEKIIETKLMRTYSRADLTEQATYLPNSKEYLQYFQDELNLARVKNAAKALYFEKQSYDVFTNPAVEKFLQFAEVKEAVVYGVATDYCVKAAVLGMQQRGVQCYVVEDAIKGVFVETTTKALEEMISAGAKLVTTKQVLEDKI